MRALLLTFAVTLTFSGTASAGPAEAYISVDVLDPVVDPFVRGILGAAREATEATQDTDNEICNPSASVMGQPIPPPRWICIPQP